MFTRLAALRVGWRAHKRLGVPRRISFFIAFACRRQRIGYAYGYGLFKQESNYRVIYGHDAGGLFPGQRVTEDNYRSFRARVIQGQGRGANGVGLGQITYWRFIEQFPGLWKPRVQVYRSMEIFAGLVVAAKGDKELAYAVYNGGPVNPNFDYAREVLEKAADIRPHLTKGS